MGTKFLTSLACRNTICPHVPSLLLWLILLNVIIQYSASDFFVSVQQFLKVLLVFI